MPEMFAVLQSGITGRAFKQKLVNLTCFNPRDWGIGSQKQVDDAPYGGGPGMVMMYEPLHAAISEAKKQLPALCKTIYLSPQGKRICQTDINQLAKTKQPLLFIAGRYEGIDERVIKHHVDEEWSLGDFVLSGGELAAMVFIDALIRLLPGALGHSASALQDSFMKGLLDCPHYTRPPCINGLQTPQVLLNGNHQEIARWRRKESLGQTWLKRRDLLETVKLDAKDQQLLNEFKHEHGYSE